MSWITLTSDDVRRCFAGPELTALQSVALGVGQSDPTTEVLAQITNDVRGYVAGCARNTLGEAGTIPEELKAAALALVAVELCGRLPVKSFLTEGRKTAAENALTKLRDVAACRFAIVPPVTAAPAAEQAGGGAAELVSSTCRQATRRKLSGL